MSYLASKAFWLGVAERALKTAAGSVITLIGTDGADLVNVNPRSGAWVVAGTVLFSLAASILSAGVGPSGSPSLVDDRPGRHAKVEAVA